MLEPQVDSTHYFPKQYLDRHRWASLWHQLDEVQRLQPQNVLEVGPGPGIFKLLMEMYEIKVHTLDIDAALQPDYIGTVLDIPLENNSFDVVCAFQVLEHLPYEQSLRAFGELVRVAKRNVIISLPDAMRAWPFALYIPKLGPLRFLLSLPHLRLPRHKFDGQHHWELNKQGYASAQVVRNLMQNHSIKLSRSFRVFENPYHRFYVFQKTLA